MFNFRFKKLTQSSRSSRPKDFRVGFFTATTIAFLHALWVAYYFGYRDGQRYWDQFQSVVEYHGTFHYELLHVSMAAALIINVVALWFRGALGWITSIAALVFVETGYLWWYLDSVRWLNTYGMDKFVELEHVWMFRHATWWNMVVLAVASALLLWQLKTSMEAYNLLKTERV